MKFTADEDDFLTQGINRHGYGQWTASLRDSDFKFQAERAADALKKRAGLKIPQVYQQYECVQKKKSVLTSNSINLLNAVYMIIKQLFESYVAST